MLRPNSDDDAFAQMNLRQGFDMRVKWIHKLRAELERLKEKHPEDAKSISKVLNETKEWLNP